MKPRDPTGGDAGARERRDQVLTQGKASVTRSIAEAPVAKDGALYFLTESDGQVPMDRRHGFGLYFHDCRYLNGYELRLGGLKPNRLVASDAAGQTLHFQLSNPEIELEDGRQLPSEIIGLEWVRTLEASDRRLRERIRIRNYSRERVELPFELRFRPDFADVFAVRGLLPVLPGRCHAPEWSDGSLRFAYSGADGIRRTAHVRFSPQPDGADGGDARFRVALEPAGEHTIEVAIALTEEPEGRRPDTAGDVPPLEALRAELRIGLDEWLDRLTAARSDSLVLNAVLDRSLRDVAALRTRLGEDEFVAAGVPWFVTLFGRDALITGLQLLAFDPALAERTLRILARHQGRRVDDWRDEEPGKILHELRVGELARLGEVPQTPYYGTVDATPLFLILLGEHSAWTGDLSLFRELRENVDRAIEWMDRWGDRNGDGYIEYRSRSRTGLVNQGWKDSGDAIPNADGTLAEPPIALVEVQAYAYRARLAAAGLFRRAGEPERAETLERAAERLRDRFERDFWSDELGSYVLALQKGGEPVKVVASNAGHALWAGIASPDHARLTRDRLMAPELFNGWGVRTLASSTRAYNPIGYHLGTVWPHDNALITAGLRRYGHDRAALRVFGGIARAARHFDGFRLPEAFGGHSRRTVPVPVRYPVASHPQAWAAGSVPFMLVELLGLRPDAFERRLRIVRPLLPLFANRVELRGLRVGRARADLLFRREGRRTRVDADVEGELEIHVDRDDTEA